MKIFPFTVKDGKVSQQPFAAQFPCVIGRIKTHNRKGKPEDRHMWTAIRVEVITHEVNRPLATIINNQEELDRAIKASAAKGDAHNIFVEIPNYLE